LLASILPGLRQVRAPLAAGYLWLVVLWVLFEPVFPARATADGLAASFYRAAELLSLAGLGIFLSFAAYLLGSLSSSALTPLLQRLLRPGESGWRTPLSPQARAALEQVVKGTQNQLVSALAFGGIEVDRFLDAHIVADERGLEHAPSKIRREGAFVPPLGSLRPVDSDSKRAARLARTVLDDLDVVAKTRLLGRDQELYAEVDRNRAEVEFRFAVIPPILALALASGARGGWWLLLVLALAGLALAWGLFVDGVRAEKTANQILLQAIADRRVRAPTLERLETEAAALAGQRAPELMETAGKDLVVALQAAADSLEEVGRSEPPLAMHARRQIGLTSEPIARVESLFPAAVAGTAAEAVRVLTELADGWVGAVEGHGPPGHDPQELLKRAQRLVEDLRVQVRQAVEEAKEKDARPVAASVRSPA
jgi:hypothetical protein